MKPVFNKKITNPFDEMALVEKLYKDLEKQCSPSFFNSWAWVSVWLRTMPRSEDLKFITYFVDNELVCCYFIGLKTISKLKLIKKDKAYLNCTGNMEFDTLTIEYNDVLVLPEYKSNVIKLIECSVDVDDIVLPITSIEAHKRNEFHYEEHNHLSHWVDLDLIRKENKPYLSYISKNKRNQINRSIKEYGDVRFEVAQTTEQALSMLDSLIRLHQKEWTSRGEPGAFSNDFFCDFHHKLISENFDAGKIQLIIVYGPKESIGVLYNFIHNNEVLFYQCGFEYKEGNNYRPGMVTHYKAIEHNLSIGISKYNFLVGSSQYKKSLSTNSDSLNTIVISKKNALTTIEKKLKKVLNRE
jgi:hypothetical protein